MSDDRLCGEVIEDRYRLESLIGRGGFGAVYRASHLRVPRSVAIKVLSNELATDPEWVARFEREMRAEVVLGHPNVVEVIDYGLVEEIGYYIAMEYLEGEDLRHLLDRQGALNIVQAFDIVAQAGSALAAAHDAGIVHRDVKAENVYLVRDPEGLGGTRVKLLDFGIASLVETKAGFADLEGDGLEGDGLEGDCTGTRVVTGSPGSMSPEQVRGEVVDLRSDIYSLGIVFFEMVTGRLPFTGSSTVDLCRKQLFEEAPVPSSYPDTDWVPEELDDLLLSMLAKEPEWRPASMREVLAACERVRAVVEQAWAKRHMTRRGPRFTPTPTEDCLLETVLAATAVVPPEPGQPTPPRRRVVSDIQPRRPVVLVVDDEEPMRRYVQRMLTRKGWDCAVAESGARALEWLESHSEPDAIVLDMLMPEMGGLELLEALRDAGHTAPVVVCSGVGSGDVEEEARQRGVIAFLDKFDDLHRLPGLIERRRTPPKDGGDGDRREPEGGNGGGGGA